jgi:Mg-chelatase subunit ChlD
VVTFITASALAIALLVVVPLIAHLLRRGGHEALDFSLARLAQPKSNLATRRSHFDDRWLFTLRALLVAALALLGAAPLIRCDRPTLARQHGASVALAIVIDDSASMRAQIQGGNQRFQLAKQTAERLISELREGDAVSIVLAGRPARVLVGATPQLRLARQLCARIRESDRSTDLGGALELAENSLHNLPQVDHRIAVLSDLAEAVGKPHANLWIPLPQLAVPVQDCGVITANQRTNQVEVVVACASAPGANRKISLVGASAGAPALSITRQLEPAKALQTIVFSQVPSGQALRAKLDGTDDNSSNDDAPIFAGVSGTVVATLSDYTTARAATGGPPLVEQALSALGSQLILRPWSALPEDEHSYSDVSLLVLDDPSTFGPEVRTPLMSWLNRGGIAVAFLGARAVSDQLGTSLSPFVEGPTVWSATRDVGFDPSTLRWLGTIAESWTDIHARARVELEGALAAAMNVRGRWSDDRLAVLERQLGRGVAWTIGLPVSPALSDIALRPAFLAYFGKLIEAARQRGLSPITVAGRPWKLDKQDLVTVTGPDGAAVQPNTPSGFADRETWYTPTLSGMYAFRRNGTVEHRVAHVEPEEVLELPRPTLISDKLRGHATPSRLETSPYVVAAIAVILLLELLTKLPLSWGQTTVGLLRRIRAK